MPAGGYGCRRSDAAARPRARAEKICSVCRMTSGRAAARGRPRRAGPRAGLRCRPAGGPCSFACPGPRSRGRPHRSARLVLHGEMAQREQFAAGVCASSYSMGGCAWPSCCQAMVATRRGRPGSSGSRRAMQATWADSTSAMSRTSCWKNSAPMPADTAEATFSTMACSCCCSARARRLLMPKARSLASDSSSCVSSAPRSTSSGA